MSLSFPATAKSLLVVCLVGLSLSGCIVTPDEYEGRRVVRYERPYPVPVPEYRDRVYTQTQRVYVPYVEKEKVYVDERHVDKVYVNERRVDNNRRDDRKDNRSRWYRYWHAHDNDQRGNSQGNYPGNHQGDHDDDHDRR